MEEMKKFKDKWPDQGLPVWVWMNGRWTIATLEKGMFALIPDRGEL